MYCRFACRRYVIRIGCVWCQERPYHDDNTASRLLSEVKHRRARLVLRWGPRWNPGCCSFAAFPTFPALETTLKSWVLLLLQHSYDTFYRKQSLFAQHHTNHLITMCLQQVDFLQLLVLVGSPSPSPSPSPSLCILDMYAAHTKQATCRILGLSTCPLPQINRRKDPQSHIFHCP